MCKIIQILAQQDKVKLIKHFKTKSQTSNDSVCITHNFTYFHAPVWFLYWQFKKKTACGNPHCFIFATLPLKLKKKNLYSPSSVSLKMNCCLSPVSIHLPFIPPPFNSHKWNGNTGEEEERWELTQQKYWFAFFSACSTPLDMWSLTSIAYIQALVMVWHVDCQITPLSNSQHT